MRKIKEVLRLKLDAGLSHERIAASLGISKGVVAKYAGLAAAAGLDWQAAQALDETGLQRRLLAGRASGVEDIARLISQDQGSVAPFMMSARLRRNDRDLGTVSARTFGDFVEFHLTLCRRFGGRRVQWRPSRVLL